MTAKRWTEEQKAEALELYVEHGPSEAARRTGIPSKTISSWAKRSGVQSDVLGNLAAAVKVAEMRWAERRARLADEAGALAEILLKRAKVEKVPRDARYLVEGMEKAAGVAQLLSGNPTSRTEHDVTDRESRLAVVRDIEGAVRGRQEGTAS